MIIGISGKKQHGKDTVAKIIQYLNLNKRFPGHSHTFESFCNVKLGEGWRDYESGWKTKKFAGKLKQVVSLLIGCTLEQLEDNTFKETPLGEEWRVWYWTHYKWPMKRITKLCMSEQEAMEIDVDGGTVIEYFGTSSRLETEVLTPRKMLQIIGTEGGRELIHPNIWVNALMADYKPKIEQGDYFTSEVVETFPNWIITDVRFPNEVEAIENRGGVVIRVNRTDIYSLDNHSSETSLDNWEFIHTITNNSTLDHLVTQVDQTLKLILNASKTKREEDTSERSS